MWVECSIFKINRINSAIGYRFFGIQFTIDMNYLHIPKKSANFVPRMSATDFVSPCQLPAK